MSSITGRQIKMHWRTIQPDKTVICPKCGSKDYIGIYNGSYEIKSLWCIDCDTEEKVR